MEPVAEKWLTREEVAELLAVPIKTTAQWAHKGTGPRFYKVGRYCRYRASDVTAWLESRATGGSQLGAA